MENKIISERKVRLIVFFVSILLALKIILGSKNTNCVTTVKVDSIEEISDGKVFVKTDKNIIVETLDLNVKKGSQVCPVIK